MQSLKPCTSRQNEGKGECKRTKVRGKKEKIKEKIGKREIERKTERTEKRMGEGGTKKGKRNVLVQTEDMRFECICRQLISQHFQSPFATLFES